MNLNIDDLLPNCKKCIGTGELENPALNQNQGSYGSKLVFASPISCPECNGKGVIPTESGKTLLEFFRLAKSKHLLY